MTRRRRRYQEPREFDTIRELVKTLHLRSKLGPIYHSEDLLVIKCRCEFEPHGRASETWGMTWSIELPYVQSYWKSNEGWRARNPGLSMKLYGRTLYEAMMKLCTFLGEMTAEGKEIEWLQPKPS